jgi:hypothetical protein
MTSTTVATHGQWNGVPTVSIAENLQAAVPVAAG